MIMPSFGVTTGGLNVLDRAFHGLFDLATAKAYVIGLTRIYPIGFRSLSRLSGYGAQKVEAKATSWQSTTTTVSTSRSRPNQSGNARRRAARRPRPRSAKARAKPANIHGAGTNSSAQPTSDGSTDRTRMRWPWSRPQRHAPANAAEKGEDRRRIAGQCEDQLRIGDEVAPGIGECRGHQHEGDQPRQTEDPRGAPRHRRHQLEVGLGVGAWPVGSRSPPRRSMLGQEA